MFDVCQMVQITIPTFFNIFGFHFCSFSNHDCTLGLGPKWIAKKKRGLSMFRRYAGTLVSMSNPDVCWWNPSSVGEFPLNPIKRWQVPVPICLTIADISMVYFGTPRNPHGSWWYTSSLEAPGEAAAAGRVSPLSFDDPGMPSSHALVPFFRRGGQDKVKQSLMVTWKRIYPLVI